MGAVGGANVIKTCFLPHGMTPARTRTTENATTPG
jgi:hypothetical protein